MSGWQHLTPVLSVRPWSDVLSDLKLSLVRCESVLFSLDRKITIGMLNTDLRFDL